MSELIELKLIVIHNGYVRQARKIGRGGRSDRLPKYYYKN